MHNVRAVIFSTESNYDKNDEYENMRCNLENLVINITSSSNSNVNSQSKLNQENNVSTEKRNIKPSFPPNHITKTDDVNKWNNISTVIKKLYSHFTVAYR